MLWNIFKNDVDIHLSETNFTWHNFHKANNHRHIGAGSDPAVHTNVLTGHVPEYIKKIVHQSNDDMFGYICMHYSHVTVCCRVHCSAMIFLINAFVWLLTIYLWQNNNRQNKRKVRDTDDQQKVSWITHWRYVKEQTGPHKITENDWRFHEKQTEPNKWIIIPQLRVQLNDKKTPKIK